MIRTILVTNGNGISYLEQDEAGTTKTLVLAEAQFAEIVQFLTHPPGKRFRAIDPIIGSVYVEYSHSNDNYTIIQGDTRLTGNRRSDNCGFSGVQLWMHRRNDCLVNRAMASDWSTETIAEVSGVDSKTVQKFVVGGALSLTDAQRLLDFFSVELSTGVVPVLAADRTSANVAADTLASAGRP